MSDNQPQVGTCPDCGGSLVSTSHGPYCPNQHCKWGWEVEMDGSPLKPPLPQPTPAEPRIESVPDERAELSRDDYHESQIQQEFMQARTNNGAIWQFWLHRQLVLARKRLAILQFDGRARAGSSLIAEPEKRAAFMHKVPANRRLVVLEAWDDGFKAGRLHGASQDSEESFVLELAAIYGLDENFMRALPVATLDMWKMLVRKNAEQHKSERETMEMFRKELCDLKFGASPPSSPGAAHTCPQECPRCENGPSSPGAAPEPDYKSLCELAARVLLQHMNDEDYEMSLAGLYARLTEHALSSPGAPQEQK